MASAPPGGRLPALGRALRHRNYRLFFAGQGISLIGTWLTRVATSWLVYRLTGSALLLGLVSFAGQIPTFALAPFAGVLIDRWNRHRILVVTQTIAMLQSAALAVLALGGVITVPQVIVLSIVQGVVNAFDMPARQSFVIEMVESRDDLPNAIALNSSLVNSARLIGPSVGGVLIAAVGEGWCFTVDAVSYLAVIASLLAMRVRPRPPARSTAPVLASLREGASYAASFPPIRALLLLLALVSFTGSPYMALTPVFAAEVLRGGPHTLGFLIGSSGIGALCGALWLASRRTVLGLGRTLIITGCLLGVGLIGYALSHWLWLSMLLLLAVGAGMMVSMGASNTILQTLVDEDKRGRVMGLYAMAFFGMAPFGNLAGGALAERFGAPATVLACGVITLIGTAVFARKLPELRRLVRPIYRQLGILPEIAEALHQTTAMSAPTDE
jgi:MFS family permease